MDSRPRKFGTRQERSNRARRKLVDAAIELTAQGGLEAFSLRDAERRACLNRGLAAYHFESALGLQREVVSQLLAREAPTGELGLRPLLLWIEGKVALATTERSNVLARARVTMGHFGSTHADERTRYLSEQTDTVSVHLARGQVLGEVRTDLDVFETASVLIGQIQGEQLRVALSSRPPKDTFLRLVERALRATERPRPSKPVTPGKASTGSSQLSLFGD